MLRTGQIWLVVLLSWSATNTWGQQNAGPGANVPSAAPLPPPVRAAAAAPAMTAEPLPFSSPQAFGPACPCPNGPAAGFVPADAASTEPLPPCADGVCRRSFWESFKAFMQWSHWGYPEEFQRTPIGTSFRANRQVQICNGQAAGLVLYRYDFCDESGEEGPGLNAHGQKRLYLMLAQCRLGGCQPLIIEPTPDNPLLDAARRDCVIKLLEGARVSSAVVIGDPLTKGPSGVEARLLDVNYLRQVAGGGGAGGGGAGGGGMGGGGATGGGGTGGGGIGLGAASGYQ